MRRTLMPGRPAYLAAAGVVALALAGSAVAGADTGAGEGSHSLTAAVSSAAAATCAPPGYAGGTLTVRCAVPPVTLPPETVTVTASPTATASSHPALPTGWGRVTFYDDFTAGLAKWNVRHNSWASNELSIVTNRPANVSTDGGHLTLRAQRENYTAFSTTRQYTSGYLDTIGKHSQVHGRWEMRAKLPRERGLWPAFWLRENTGAGELDIVESVGTGTGARAQTTVQTIHQSTNGDLAKRGHEDTSVTDLTAWHTYAVEREPGAVRWYIDNRLVFKVTSTDTSWLDSTFDQPMNIRLNLQVGGAMPNWYGLQVDATTQLPDAFQIAYVRVLAR
jgi:beta-glucanase (GH16 family)